MLGAVVSKSKAIQRLGVLMINACKIMGAIESSWKPLVVVGSGWKS